VAIPKKVRDQVNARDRWCRGCGAQGTQVHHIKFKSQGGRDELWNLVRLCNDCHPKAHNLGSEDSLKSWELQLAIDVPVATVHVLRTNGSDRCCGGCDHRTVDNRCLVWDQDVTWDYLCETFRRRTDNYTG
jgi:hypothetical protein